MLLAIESSCDETACAVVKDGCEILSSIVSSQINVHTLYGGVVPEVASRIHVENISTVVCEALQQAKVTMDDIDAIADRSADEAAHRIIAVVLVAENVLAAEQHLQLGVGHAGANFTQALPGILVQKTEAHVERCAAPDLGGIVARLIDRAEDRLKLGVRQTRGNQRLIGVAKYRLRKLYFHRQDRPFRICGFLLCTTICHTSHMLTIIS